MRFAKLDGALDNLSWWAWLALLATLPITSQPQVAQLVGGRPVGPVAILPLVVVMVAGVLPNFLRRGRLPRPAAPLLLFGAIAALGTILSPWLGIPPFKGQDVVARGIRALMTLAIGISFYLAAVLMPTDRKRMRQGLLAVLAGAVPLLLWSSLQLWFLVDGNPLRPQWTDDLQDVFSLRGLYLDRVTGLAYEPSWLADQLVVFYLPLWLGCILTGVSAVPRRLWRFSIEHGLFVWGTIILLATFSRIGIAAWGLVLAVLAVFGGWRIGTRLASRLANRAARGRRSSRLVPSVITFGVLVGLILVTVAGVLVMAQLDERVARVLTLSAADLADSRHPLWYAFANRLKYAERVIYWTAAARTFAQFPVLGVGVGNSGLLFREVVPAFGYILPEILDGLSPGLFHVFPNPKSLWFRLLAETGLLGTAAFLTWLLVLAAAAWAAFRRDRRGLYGAVAMGSLLCLIALPGEGFSLDTFALPYMWLLPGMATAGWLLAQNGPESTLEDRR